jgi:hypothetical protein
LTAVGSEAFPAEKPTRHIRRDDLLDITGKALPTDIGLRRLEEEAQTADGLHNSATETAENSAGGDGY